LNTDDWQTVDSVYTSPQQEANVLGCMMSTHSDTDSESAPHVQQNHPLKTIHMVGIYTAQSTSKGLSS